MGGRGKEGRNEGRGKARQSKFLKLHNMQIIETEHTMRLSGMRWLL